MQLDFALGKAYGDLKDYRRSFTHLLAGNAAKRATISYDEASDFRLVRPHRGRLHPRIDRAKIRRRRPVARADFRHRHAALGHDLDRADHRQPSAGARRRRIADVQRRHSHGARAGRQCPALSGIRAGARCGGVTRRSAPVTLPMCASSRRAASASPTRCRRTIISPASSTSRCRMPRSSIPFAIRSTPAFPASPSCSPPSRTTPTISPNSAATTSATRR